MKLTDQIKRIRRFLRDPNSKIWDDDYLIKLFNDVQEDLQNKTKILEDVSAIKFPPTYHFTYMYDWEYAYLPSKYSQFYQAFKRNQQSSFVHTYDWEQQQVWSINVDVTTRGSAFTQPWESAYLLPNDEIPIRFPEQFRNAKFVAFDREPITFKEKREIQETDSTYITTTGKPCHYYRGDELDNSFTLYPRPTQYNWIEGDGMALFHSADTVDSEVGAYLRRFDSTPSQDLGTADDVIDADDNVFLWYEKNAKNLETKNETSPFPIYLRKYIEYGVISRAYLANTDGRIESLGNYWQRRYSLGLIAIKRFMLKRRSDRNYQFTGDNSLIRTTRKHPRLPSTYPNVDHI